MRTNINSMMAWHINILTRLIVLTLALSSVTKILAQQCGQAYLQTCAATASWAKCGYTACATTTPPTIYLTKEEDVDGYYHNHFTSEGITGDIDATYDWTDTSTTDPASCIETDAFSGSQDADAYLDGSCSASVTDATADIWTGDCWASSYLVGYASVMDEEFYSPAITCTTSEYSKTYTDAVSWSSGADSVDSHFYLAYTYTYSSVYTDDMLRGVVKSKIPPYSTNWTTGCGTAFWAWNGSDHTAASGGRMKYRFHLMDTQLHTTYKVKWHQITHYADGSPDLIQKMSEEVQGNGDPVNGVYTSVHNVDVPVPECTIFEVEDKVTVVSKSKGGS